MPPATFLAQHRDCADRNTRRAQGDMYSEDHRQKDGVGRRNFDARHDRGFSACHDVCSQLLIGFVDEDGRLTAKAPAPHVKAKRTTTDEDGSIASGPIDAGCERQRPECRAGNAEDERCSPDRTKMVAAEILGVTGGVDGLLRAVRPAQTQRVQYADGDATTKRWKT